MAAQRHGLDTTSATRAMPSTTAVVMPVRAVGNTTDHTVRARDDPMARLASRRPSGTRRSTTSTVRVIVGSMIIASARLAMNPLKPNRGIVRAYGRMNTA